MAERACEACGLHGDSLVTITRPAGDYLPGQVLCLDCRDLLRLRHGPGPVDVAPAAGDPRARHVNRNRGRTYG